MVVEHTVDAIPEHNMVNTIVEHTVDTIVEHTVDTIVEHAIDTIVEHAVDPEPTVEYVDNGDLDSSDKEIIEESSNDEYSSSDEMLTDNVDSQGEGIL